MQKFVIVAALAAFALVDRFGRDMDDNLREMGVGDLTVPKKMKRMFEALYGRTRAYRSALESTLDGTGSSTGSEALEAALWTAVRTFREKSVLAKQLSVRERSRGNAEVAVRFDEQATQAERYAALIVAHVLQSGDAAPGGPVQSAHSQ